MNSFILAKLLEGARFRVRAQRAFGDDLRIRSFIVFSSRSGILAAFFFCAWLSNPFHPVNPDSDTFAILSYKINFCLP